MESDDVALVKDEVIDRIKRCVSVPPAWSDRLAWVDQSSPLEDFFGEWQGSCYFTWIANLIVEVPQSYRVRVPKTCHDIHYIAFKDAFFNSGRAWALNPLRIM